MALLDICVMNNFMALDSWYFARSPAIRQHIPGNDTDMSRILGCLPRRHIQIGRINRGMYNIWSRKFHRATEECWLSSVLGNLNHRWRCSVSLASGTVYEFSKGSWARDDMAWLEHICYFFFVWWRLKSRDQSPHRGQGLIRTMKRVRDRKIKRRNIV